MESGPPLTIWSASGGKAIECALFLRGQREKRRRRPLTAGPLSTGSELALYGSSMRPLIFFHLSWKKKKWQGTSNGFTLTSVWELRDHNRTTVLEFPFGKAMHCGSDWETLDVWHGGKNVRWVLRVSSFMGLFYRALQTLSKSHYCYGSFMTKYVNLHWSHYMNYMSPFFLISCWILSTPHVYFT